MKMFLFQSDAPLHMKENVIAKIIMGNVVDINGNPLDINHNISINPVSYTHLRAHET